MGPNLAPKLLNMESTSGPIFGPFLGKFWAMLGAILESKWAKKRQHVPKKVLKSLTVPKSSNCKKV